MTEWFRQLALREQIVLGAGTALAVMIIAWQFIWAPLSSNVIELRESVGERSRLVVDLRRAANVTPASGAGAATAGTQSPMLLIDEPARRYGLAGAITGTRPEANGIRVTVDNATFTALVDWMIELERQHGLRATTVTLNGTGEPGLVRGQIMLSRG